MFCRKCGNQNPTDANFCISCGTSMSVIQDFTTLHKVKIKETPVETVSHINAFQKIFLLIALVWFIVALYYIPYKGDNGIVYDVVWAKRTEKFHFLRIILLFGTLFSTTYILYRYLRRFKTLENLKYKKYAKRELYLFFLFVFSIFVCGFYLLGTNFINKKRDYKLATQIAILEQQVKQNSKKKNIRQSFYNEANSKKVKTWEEVFEHVDKGVNSYWDFLQLNMENHDWITNYYDTYKKHNRLGIIEDDNYNTLQAKFGIESSDELKSFIKDYALTSEDFTRDQENKAFNDKIIKIRTEKSQLSIYSNNDIRRITLTVIAIAFILLYMLRPLIWFVNGLFSEIK